MDNQTLISNYKAYISETSTSRLKRMCAELLKVCDFGIVGFTEKYFEPQGYTAVWLLSESHLAIHTFPEKNTTYLELSSCNAEKNQLFVEKLKGVKGVELVEYDQLPTT